VSPDALVAQPIDSARALLAQPGCLGIADRIVSSLLPGLLVMLVGHGTIVADAGIAAS
jgi:hypothetical protein